MSDTEGLRTAGTAVVTTANATGQYVNTATGATEAFDSASTLSPTMKTYYDTELLENAREEHYFAQFGRKQGLPANKGRTVEWRKWNTLPPATTPLVEGVVPDGQKLGMTTLSCTLSQYGMYVAITDLLDLHAIDNVLLGATEELGASAGDTQDILIRNVLEQGTNVMYADNRGADGAPTPVATASGIAGMDMATNRLTPDTVNQAYTALKKAKAPTIGGKYVAVIHPSVAYDLRSSEDWVEAHKYAANTEIFNGEIGELHGVRFVENTLAKVTAGTFASGTTGVYYDTIFMGKDAYGIIDPAGGAMEMIVKDRSEVGGPLEQYSTAGYKFETACKILYPERLLRVLSCSKYSSSDSAN